ncbi:FUSC family protein [Streptomyces sp. NPDC050617]|uniref:FUSC family protein n=1 Tax=Streptomyces sp. NPDC050617 TaxID=3154628 RepID=UPI003435582B
MAKHAKHRRTLKEPSPSTPARGVRVRPLPVRSAVRLNRAADIWHKSALSAGVAMAIPNLTLLATGHLQFALYTSAGALCALYGHAQPYAARARTLAWVVLGMVASVAVALVSSSLITSAPLLVLIASLLAALHKMVCDATLIGPPGNIIVTFVTASAFFVPQHIGDVPFHLGIVLACGALSWLVCMAPALVRPRGPERILTARALEAAARALRAEPGAGRGPRHATATAVNAAWHALFLVRDRDVKLERLLIRAESTLAVAPGADEAGRFEIWARDLRKGRPLPLVALTPAQRAELLGVGADGDRHAPRRPSPDRPRGFGAVLRRLRPGSPLLPIGARVAAGCAVAGWASMAVGVGHPYWAVVTAAAVFQANTTLTWNRALQRTLGNFLGLLLFTALLPLIRTGHLTMVLLALVFQICAEAFISRNYWLGSVCVTPMALLLTEFANNLPASRLIADRWIDTVVGAVVGVLACVLVTNRRATDRIESALRHVSEARESAVRLLATSHDHHEAGWARDRLAAALIELREAVDVASGEWWQRALPEERVALAEQEGHRTLASLVRRLSAPVMAA